jgi:PQQ-dependent dehydrogenase (methanol/ethanol family)
MPAFDLPGPDLSALVAFVRLLNSPAAESLVAGSLAAGKQFFFGTGRCASCHMVGGRGVAIGPDLSNVGREMSVEEIRQALLEPAAHITPGYDLVTVQLRDGHTIRGFARQRSEFDIQLQDLEGRLHSLQLDQISVVQDEKQPLMPRVKASTQELQDVIAYLSRLEGAKAGETVANESSASGGIDFLRILKPQPGDWPAYDGTLSGHRYSQLTQINSANVDRLIVKWISPIPHFGLEVTPLVVDGIMYVSAANQAFALDARSGRQIWQYSRSRTSGLVGDASLGTNRGLALLGDKVFMVTDNAHLIALNRTAGRLVWDAVMPDEPQHYGSTVAPLVVKDLVIAGVSGADWGIRGFLSAYKASTGERAWRFWTIPAKGDSGYDTWKGKDPKFGGGSTWLTGSYDPETDTLYWPTATPFPVSDDRYRGGDNLFTDCILALNPDTGTLKWHYQTTPHDVHAWDTTEPLALVDAPYRGVQRKLLLHADRNGFFYVFDRAEGQLLLATPFVRVTWASGIGPDGRPQPRPSDDGVICPVDEATNYNATSFSPVTRLYYVMALEHCGFVAEPGKWNMKRPQLPPASKYLRALNIETGKVAWEIAQIGTTESKHWAGVLGTAGGILFYGEPGGAFVAVDERDGKSLWHFPTNEVIKASPITYMVDSEQFVAIAAGSNVISFGLPR